MIQIQLPDVKLQDLLFLGFYRISSGQINVILLTIKKTRLYYLLNYRLVESEVNVMDKTASIEAKERIIAAAKQLFSQKGYDATRVNDIASVANVNKALIYYYFKSKQDILDYMVDSLLINAVSIALGFIQKNIVQMIKAGDLDIRPERLHFVSDEAIKSFMQNSAVFYERLIDYVIDNKEIIRILMLESLKNGKHQNSLFRFMKFMSGDEIEPIFETISDTDHNFVYSDEMVMFNFFFSIIPIISFAAYFDDYKAVTSRSDDELRSSFLRVYQLIAASLISGGDILLRNDSTSLH